MDPETVLEVLPTVGAMPLDDELTLFDTATGRALALNRTAADVFALIDGKASLAEITARAAKAYGLAPGDVGDQVHDVVAQLLLAEALAVVQASGPRRIP